MVVARGEWTHHLVVRSRVGSCKWRVSYGGGGEGEEAPAESDSITSDVRVKAGIKQAREGDVRRE